MTKPLAGAPLGRPRGFVPSAALDVALAVFWRQGYGATSLDDLTAAMGVSRSSFYGAFGSKHAVLIAAVQVYVDRIFAALQGLVAAAPGPIDAVRAVITRIADPDGDSRGCLLVNAVTELAPQDPDLDALARMHLDRVVGLIASLLRRAGFADAEDRAGALLSCAFGATMLRKAGLPGDRLLGLLAQTEALLRQPPGE